MIRPILIVYMIGHDRSIGRRALSCQQMPLPVKDFCSTKMILLPIPCAFKYCLLKNDQDNLYLEIIKSLEPLYHFKTYLFQSMKIPYGRNKMYKNISHTQLQRHQVIYWILYYYPGSMKKLVPDAHGIFRIPPFYYLHILDQSSNITRVLAGPTTFVRQVSSNNY